MHLIRSGLHLIMSGVHLIRSGVHLIRGKFEGRSEILDACRDKNCASIVVKIIFNSLKWKNTTKTLYYTLIKNTLQRTHSLKDSTLVLNRSAYCTVVISL